MSEVPLYKVRLALHYPACVKRIPHISVARRGQHDNTPEVVLLC